MILYLQVLTEEETPTIDASKVGVISVTFKRCKVGRIKKYGSGEGGPSVTASALVGPFNERAKIAP